MGKLDTTLYHGDGDSLQVAGDDWERFVGAVEPARVRLIDGQGIERLQDTYRQLGDRRNEGNWLANTGLLAERQGQAAHARELWEQALRIFEAIQDPNAERVRGWLARLDVRALLARLLDGDDSS